MKANDAFLQAVAVSKKFTKDSFLGGGALVGKNVAISKIEPIPGGNRVTFSYTLDNGQIRTSTLDVMDGKDGSPGTDGADGRDGVDGQDGNGILDISKIETEGLVDTYRISLTDGTHYDYEVKNGEQGIQGVPGPQGKDGVEGKQGIQGTPGERGRDGYPFLIYKEYADISEFSADDFPEIGLMFMINDRVSSLFPVYRYTGDEEGPYSYVTSLSGAEPIKGDKGDPGAQGEQGVPGRDGKDGITYAPKTGVVNTLPPEDPASASVNVDAEESSATFNFSIPRGKEGKQGIPGRDGQTPHIGDNNHWYIGDSDTEVPATGPPGEKGKDGKSITEIRTDEENNVIVSFSDGTESNIGKLNIPAEITIDSALDPTSENPVQNKAIAARLTELSSEITTAGETQKAYTDKKVGDLVGAAPETLNTIEEVADAIQENETVVDALNAAIGNKVDKVAGKGLSTNDFTTEEKNKLAGIPTVNNAKLTIQRNGTQVQTFTANQGTDVVANILVPTKISELEDDAGFGSSSVTVDAEMSETSTNPVQNKVITAYINKLHGSTLHGFEINQAESDPYSMVTYIEDSVTRSPAYMDYANDKFNYGGWGSEWFIQNLKPCMLNYDGTVDYELDKNNHTKKKDGTTSDVANENFTGNAMVGIPKVYWKISRISDDVARIFFCDENMDGTFKCWSHLDSDGKEIPYCYMPIYNGSLVGSRLRNLSGRAPITNMTTQQDINYAKANNPNGKSIWYIEVFSDRTLINLLLMLIGRTTDTQTVFGKGLCYSSESSIVQSGTMDQKGLFWGSSDISSGVKVFGMEHYWGNVCRRIAGWILDKGTQKTKMTYGKFDGSTVAGYNLDGAGYVSVPNSAPLGESNGYISKYLFSNEGIVPLAMNGSSSTYYCDAFSFDNSKTEYPLVGNPSVISARVGAFSGGGSQAATTYWNFSSSLSCKPLA